MKTSDKTPSEMINDIANIINERSSKNLPTFFTISIEQGDKGTPVAEKEEGHENFRKQVLKYMSDYNLTGLTVQLYSGKSRNVKVPFQTFKISLKKQNPTIILGNVETDPPQSNEVQQLESSIPVSRYYDEKFELQMKIMRSEMEKTNLIEQVNRLTEKYEDKLKELEKTYGEKLHHMEQQVQQAEQDREEFEKEIIKHEKDKHGAFSNIALGSIASHAIENLAKSRLGTGVLKGLLGNDGYQTLQGHLAGIDKEQNELPEKSTARIITQPETKDPRTVALNFIQTVGQSFPDSYLRMLYDIAEMGSKNVNDLHMVWSYAQHYKEQQQQQAQNPNTTPVQQTSHEPGEDETPDSDQDEDDTTNLP